MAKTFYITTMGCQMNVYDSDALAQALIGLGYCPAEAPSHADLILINTCTVREKPVQKAHSLIGRLSALKEKRPDLVLGVMGCLAQEQGDGLLKQFPQLDLVMGPRDLGNIQIFLEKIDSERRKIVAGDLESSTPHLARYHGYFKGRVSAYISIMEGCNNFCTYCIVPFVRGREISRSPKEILWEAQDLISQGVKEIMLLGQNVNSYAWDGHQPCNFPYLLHEVNRLKGLMRLRFTTSHPKDLSNELMECFGSLTNLCPHIHLPFQAGSNAILQRMKRGYTREKYLALIEKLRGIRPDIAITSDVMVGFPGETDRDFEMTLDLLERVRFDGLFSFKYSDRKGTAAEKMTPKVSESDKATRLTILQGLQKKITLEKNKQLEGQQVDVLIEGQSKKGGQLTGRTGSNRVVNIIGGNPAHVGQMVRVTIKDGLLNSLRAEP